jgi:hypothetical protein
MTGHSAAGTNGGVHDLARLLRQYEPAQVWYQLEEIVGDRTYLRRGDHVRRRAYESGMPMVRELVRSAVGCRNECAPAQAIASTEGKPKHFGDARA